MHVTNGNVKTWTRAVCTKSRGNSSVEPNLIAGKPGIGPELGLMESALVCASEHAVLFLLQRIVSFSVSITTGRQLRLALLKNNYPI